MFDPKLNFGDELTNEEMRSIFQCGNMGGMRRSKKTGTLVIISDDTKELYHDEWKDGVLHYTGMGKLGDQVLEGNQNDTLYHSDTNGVVVHLFEVMKKAIYTYRGVTKLVDQPYIEKQIDDHGTMRNVWIFPIKPIIECDKIDNRSISESEIAKLSNMELVRRTQINQIDREPKRMESVVYYRDPYVKELVKRIAEGKCQYCGKIAPFNDKKGKPYLEEHHVKRLADGGSDTIDNVVAICPNCHRRMHVLGDLREIAELESIAMQNKNRMIRFLSYRAEI